MSHRARFRFLLLGLCPLAFLAAATALAWRAFLSGGMKAVLGWIALMSAIPLLAIVVGAGTVFRTARTQRRPYRLVATTLLAAFCLWPAGWNAGVAPIAFPYSIERSTPASTVRLPTDAPMR